MSNQNPSDLEQMLSPLFAKLEREVAQIVAQVIDSRLEEARTALTLAASGVQPASRAAPSAAKAPKKRARKGRKGKRRKGDVRIPLAEASENVHAVLAQQSGPVSIRVVQNATGYSESQSRRALRNLVRQGRVLKIGERKDTVYTVTARKASRKATKKTGRKATKK